MALFKSPIELSSARINVAQRKITGVTRPGLVMFYSHGCGHCIAMQNTWQQLHNEIGREFEIHAIDCSGSQANQQKCGEMGIMGYPTIYKFDRTGKLGGQPPSRELSALKSYLKGGQAGGARRRRSVRKSPRKTPRRSPRRSLKRRK